ncbi:GNAT family N-acetyltransferase [Pedobacter heparinus]|uniref:GCN5-related N-acetyltransferase n=1 Tax=Pedobacter heparinus (strain ATCC 13125 / DSM 2366 / CIP 104194 / JCM 7457 / NBRC 12017 / NCIMB 9290 / NRRL B-14731 / HIM 762-3) TaxID=485917 RepID=C6XVD4_PEDHD|nr:GNAT family N-acetyltransferase [Pedobacter heparinus]ACU04000.1 GCN5-related N-acetyltransferase [Pedobacter heparinus DSM 2366]
MKRAEPQHKARILNILTESFDTNLSVNYVVKQDTNWKQRIAALMEYSFEVCMMFGDVWISDDEKACALAIYPERRKTTLKTMWLDAKLILTSIGIRGIFKALKRESKIKRKQLNLSNYYLWFIGVDRNYQRKRIGTKLLAEVKDYATAIGRPILLETSTLSNLPWYEKNGFQVYEQLDLSYRLFFLKTVNAN